MNSYCILVSSPTSCGYSFRLDKRRDLQKCGHNISKLVSHLTGPSLFANSGICFIDLLTQKPPLGRIPSVLLTLQMV